MCKSAAVLNDRGSILLLKPPRYLSNNRQYLGQRCLKEVQKLADCLDLDTIDYI